jgi:hypothetical protein
MQILTLLIIGIFFSGLFYYLINFALVPYTAELILDVQNLIIVSIVFSFAIACIFGFFHAGLDKLFILKFYEKPRIVLSLRRGFFIGIFLSSLAWLRIFGFWQWHIVLLVFILILLIEALFYSFSKYFEKRRKLSESEDMSNKIKN